MIPPPILRLKFLIHKFSLKIKALSIAIDKEYVKLRKKEDSHLAISAHQSMGMDIADDVVWFGEDIQIDQTRPSLVHIGHNVFLHNGFRLRTHDYATYVFLHSYNEFISSSGGVWIGDNVWFGENVTVLKGSKIGSNCIIGINSVVMGEIPDNSVAAGCPAKVICTLEEYFEKRKKKSVEEAFEYAQSIKERYGRRPEPKDFWEEFTLFVSGNQVEEYPEIPIKRQLGPAYSEWCLNHKAMFASFDDFLAAAGI